MSKLATEQEGPYLSTRQIFPTYDEPPTPGFRNTSLSISRIDTNTDMSPRRRRSFKHAEMEDFEKTQEEASNASRICFQKLAIVGKWLTLFCYFVVGLSNLAIYQNDYKGNTTILT